LKNFGPSLPHGPRLILLEACPKRRLAKTPDYYRLDTPRELTAVRRDRKH
jgi:hypothetical protein